MLNHANPALAGTSNSGWTLVLFAALVDPPPCTRMAAGNGPSPSEHAGRAVPASAGAAYPTSLRSSVGRRRSQSESRQLSAWKEIVSTCRKPDQVSQITMELAGLLTSYFQVTGSSDEALGWDGDPVH